MMNLKSLDIKSENGMLLFKDAKSFKKAYKSISKYDLKISQIKEFEKLFVFKSLRSRVLPWEKNEDEINSKKLNNIIQDPALQILLSAKNKVKIGETIYDFTLSKLLKNKKSNKTNSCKIYLFGNGTKYYSTSNSKRVKLNGYIIYVPFLLSIMGAKVKSQRRKNNGQWKGYRTKLQVAIVGDERNKRCDRPTTIGKSKGPKNRKTLSVSLIKWGGNGMWFKPMEASAKCVYGSSGVYGVFLT